MKYKSRSPISIVIIGLLILINLNPKLSAVIYYNDSDIGLKGQEENVTATPLRSHLIKGARYFLKSCSNLLNFLSQIEAAEVESPNYKELSSCLKDAIENMNMARNIFKSLIKEARENGYKPEIRAKLKNFKYDQFQERYKLLKPIFDSIKSHLINGDIEKVYEEMIIQSGEILDVVYSIKEDIDAEKFPGISSLYNLSEYCSRAQLYGQYVARVFNEVKKNNNR